MIDLRSPRRRHAGANGAARGLWNASATGPVADPDGDPRGCGGARTGGRCSRNGSDGRVPVRSLPARCGDSNAEQWESSAGVTSWEQAPAPALAGKRLVEGLLGIELAPSRTRLVNNVMHWAYGILNGAQYGIVAESLPTPRIRYGLPFGATVWAGDYAILPAAKLYEPIWAYDAKTLANDLSAHLVYGLATAATLRVLSPRHE